MEDGNACDNKNNANRVARYMQGVPCSPMYLDILATLSRKKMLRFF